MCRRRADLVIENLALKERDGAEERSALAHRSTTSIELSGWCSRSSWSAWASRLVIVNAGTVARWRRARFRRYWARISQRRHPGRPRADAEIRGLIRLMAQDGVDTRSTPAVLRHQPDQSTNLGVGARSSRMPALGSPRPVSPERSRCHRATVSALTMSRRLAHAGHELRSATQKARSSSSSRGRGRFLFSAVTCCLKARFSITRSARRRHIARNARARWETRKMSTRSMSAEFRLLRPGTRAGCKSLISRADVY